MQFALKLSSGAPDLERLRQALRTADPSSMVDMEQDGASLRIASSLDSDRLSSVITDAGHAVACGELERLPYECCCGGCAVSSRHTNTRAAAVTCRSC